MRKPNTKMTLTQPTMQDLSATDLGHIMGGYDSTGGYPIKSPIAPKPPTAPKGDGGNYYRDPLEPRDPLPR